MYFQHSAHIWADFPQLVPGVLYAEGITPGAAVEEQKAKYYAVAESRLLGGSETELPEIQAWRRVFSAMGLKPTQYRCASESLLRRFRKENSLPQLTPVIDLCNAISLAFAIPIAVFDVRNVSQFIEVRYAAGDEVYVTFSEEEENPEPHEVVFADADGRAHARRWTNRQSGYSAVRDDTPAVLIVAEAMHDTAATDIHQLTEAVASAFTAVWSITPKSSILSSVSPRFDC